MNKLKRNKGFTLIELMIVISIIGILASIAIPQYHNYTARAQVSEALALVANIQPQVKDFYQAKGRFPKNNREAGVPAADKLIGNYIVSMTVEEGAIHAKLGNRIFDHLQDKIVSIQPMVVSGSPLSPISFICGYAKAPKGMEKVGVNKSDIDEFIVPHACR